MLNKYFRGLFAPVFISALLFLAQGCSKSSNPASPSPPPSSNSVSIVDNAFQPNSLPVDSGTTVTWKNNGSVTHTVTSDSGLFDSNDIAPGGTYSHAFLSRGAFGYHCKIHAGMTGSITVK